MTVMRISIKLLKEPEENGEGELAQSRDFFFFFSAFKNKNRLLDTSLIIGYWFHVLGLG